MQDCDERDKKTAVIRTPKRELLSNLQKKCLVCGDRASGFNFNALTCESCKAFYRRHAITPKEYKCPFTNNCEITAVTRRFCQKCRLKKCLSVGMIKKRTNRTEKRRRLEEKREKQRLLYEYRTSNKGNESENHIRDVSFKNKPVVETDVSNKTTNGSNRIVESVLSTDNKNQFQNEKVFSMEDIKNEKEDIDLEYEKKNRNSKHEKNNQNNRLEPSPMEAILSEVVRVEFAAFSSTNSCQESSRELNEVEQSKLNELIVANKTLHVPIDFDLSQLVGESSNTGQKSEDLKYDPRMITIVNLTAVAIRRFIKMAKKINAFKSMCEEDQVALLKGGCIELMVLRSTMTYDESSKQWKLPHTEQRFSRLHTDVLKCAEDLYLKHAAFIHSFEERWRLDENVILIMSAILLFTPERPRVLRHDIIKSEQNSYYYLLRRYLESLYPGCRAKSDFLKLIQKILELRKIAEEVTGIYLNVGPVEPLLMEIIS